MPIATLDADVVINGSSMLPYLVSIQRKVQLCDPAKTSVDIYLSKAAPFATILPFQGLVISEQGVTTLTGYVDFARASRDPKTILVKGQDTFKLAAEYYLEDEIFTNGESIAYWVGYLCNLCGLSYSILGSGSGVSTGIGVGLGMRYVADALGLLSAYAKWCMRVTPAGVLNFLSTTNPTSADYTLTDVTEYELENSDADTRNVAKVWGSGVQFSKTQPVAGISPDRIMVFADPNITTPAQAEALADAALEQYASISTENQFRIIGNPNLQVGHALTVNRGASSWSGVLTHLESTLSLQGYSQQLTFNRRCWRLPSFPSNADSFCNECDEQWEVIYTAPGATQTTFSGLDVNAQGVFSGGRTNAGSNRSFLQRYSLGGALLWEKFYDDLFVNDGRIFSTTVAQNTFSVAVDDTYAYVVGFDNFPVDEGTRVKKILIEDGSVAWNKTTPWDKVATSGGICVNSLGVYTSGYYDVTTGTEKGWWIEGRSLVTGDQSWLITIPDDNNRTSFPFWMTCDENGIYVIGFDHLTTSSGDTRGQRVKVVKITSGGGITWVRNLGFDNLNSVGFSCAIDSTGQYLYILYWDGSGTPFTIRRLLVVSGADSSVQFNVSGYGPDSIAVNNEGVYQLSRQSGSVVMRKYHLTTGVQQCGASFGLGSQPEVVRTYGGSVYACTRQNPAGYLKRWCG